MVALGTACRVAVLTLVAVASMAAGPRDTLSRARQLYNKGQYDQAIDAAREAGRVPEFADASALVLARAYLERFRLDGSPTDLPAARDALKQIRTAELTPDDRVELAIALGESLYFDNQPGAAAEQFELALARADQKDPERRERVLDWWGGALDRQARLGTVADAHAMYARVIKRMEDELLRNAESPVASYWLVAGARGSGDVERAWNAAVAAWVRAPRGVSGTPLRNDLDRIVVQAIIPERAREMAPSNPQSAAAAMRSDWERFKEAWTVR